MFNIARRMVELDEVLASRCQVFKERLEIPARDAQFHCLPAEPKRLEGLDYTLAILDEAGVANRDSHEVLTLAQGKRERSTLVAIGTPGPNLEDQVLLDLRAYAAEHPDDLSLVWREFSAAGFEDHPPDCAHCWELANPALDDFLHRDALHALLPPKTRESTFRRARLCQSATDTEGTVPTRRGVGRAVHRQGCPGPRRGGHRPRRLVLRRHHGPTGRNRLHGTTFRRDPGVGTARPKRRRVSGARRRGRRHHPRSCRRWQVVEIIADPFRWTRTLQALEAERLPVVEFPHSPARLTAATTDLYCGCR